MGTTVVTIVVSSADSLVFSFNSESVSPVEFFEFISLIALKNTSVEGFENSKVPNLETKWLSLLFN